MTPTDVLSRSATSPSTSPSTFGQVKMRRGRAKACTNCRQVKLKCNARETWPQPCFRCKAQGAECRMDSSFRRVPARRQLEEVSQKLNSLQRLLNTGQQPQQQQTLPVLSDPLVTTENRKGQNTEIQTQPLDRSELPSQLPLPQLEFLGPSRSQVDTPTERKFLQLETENHSWTWTLGGVTLTYDVAKTLFVHFDENKWHHVSFLQPCVSLQKLYADNDLLFWTVILQAARNHALYGSYFFDLLPHHRLLLGAGLLGYNLQTLHALLLVCTWPYPNPRQTPEEMTAKILRNRDPSWALLGAASNIATMMGLHKPGHQEEFGYDIKDPEKMDCGDTYTRNVTWLHTFHLITSQSSWLGITPPLSSASHLDTVATLCKEESIPKWMRAKADIQRRVVQFTIQLDTTLDIRTRYSLVNVFDQYIDRARDNFTSVWSQELEVDYLGAKLYLYGIAFVNSPNNLGYIPVEDPGIMARNILQRGLTSAVRLCHTVCNMKFRDITVPGSQSGGLSSYTYQLSWYPKRFNLAVAFATIFLAWFLAVDTQALDADRKLARKYMDDVRRMYASFHHSQEHLNLGRKLENLTSLPITAPKLTVSSRLGASFMYSYNFMYRYLKAAHSEVKESRRHPEFAVNSQRAVDREETPLRTDDNISKINATDPGQNPVPGPTLSLPDAWEMPWSEWDPAVFEELQNLTWGQPPWEMETSVTDV